MVKTILIYEDNEDLRESLIRLIGTDESFEVIGEYENCLHAGEHVQEFAPDMVLMDIDMPKTNGIEAMRILRKEYPELPVMMLTDYDDDAKIIDSICSGANGYTLKTTSSEKIIEGIHDVYNGHSSLCPPVAQKILKLFSEKFVWHHTGTHERDHGFCYLSSKTGWLRYKDVKWWYHLNRWWFTIKTFDPVD